MDKKNMTGIIAAIGALAVLVLLVVLNQNNTPKETTMNNESQSTQQMSDAQTTPDIVQAASDTASLSTLVTAVKAAGLVETLQGEGPFTVLAPTNDAFAALPAGTLDDLLKPENKETLAGILKYHVIAGKVMSSDLKDGQVVTTVQGQTLTVSLMDGKAMLTDAKGGKAAVSTADVTTSNGVVHIIDTVLMPQS